MILKKHLKLSAFMFLCLSACKNPSVEKNFNEFRNASSCILKDYSLGMVEINLKKMEDNEILVFFKNRWGIRFKPDSQFIFNVYTKEKEPEAIKLIALSSPESKKWGEKVFNFSDDETYGPPHSNFRIAFTNITREQVLKIANAEKVVFALETFYHPVRGELNKEALKPFQEFAQKCLVQ